MTRPIHSIEPGWLTEDLAVIDAAEKLKSYFKGEYQPLKGEEIHKWYDRFYKWGSIALPFGIINKWIQENS
jgi:hypothetical protein